MTLPTEGDTYSQLMEHLRKAQEAAAILAHLHKANDHHRTALSWLAVSEQFKKMQYTLTQLAMGKMN
jgi:phosphoribosyl 1,2-cyclic phosphodiesterase